MTIVNPVFHIRDIFGRHHIRGKAKGPTQKTARTIKDVRKYQGIRFPSVNCRHLSSRNSPQCLHFIASFCISSAQYGHFFISQSHIKRNREKFPLYIFDQSEWGFSIVPQFLSVVLWHYDDASDKVDPDISR